MIPCAKEEEEEEAKVIKMPEDAFTPTDPKESIKNVRSESVKGEVYAAAECVARIDIYIYIYIYSVVFARNWLCGVCVCVGVDLIEGENTRDFACYADPSSSWWNMACF